MAVAVAVVMCCVVCGVVWCGVLCCDVLWCVVLCCVVLWCVLWCGLWLPFKEILGYSLSLVRACFEFLAKLTFGALRRNPCVNSIRDHRKKNAQCPRAISNVS